MSLEKSGILQMLSIAKAKWEESRSLWNDDVRKRFDEEFIAPLIEISLTVNKEIEHLDEFLLRSQLNMQKLDEETREIIREINRFSAETDDQERYSNSRSGSNSNQSYRP